MRTTGSSPSIGSSAKGGARGGGGGPHPRALWGGPRRPPPPAPPRSSRRLLLGRHHRHLPELRHHVAVDERPALWRAVEACRLPVRADRVDVEAPRGPVGG